MCLKLALATISHQTKTGLITNFLGVLSKWCIFVEKKYRFFKTTSPALKLRRYVVFYLVYLIFIY